MSDLMFGGASRADTIFTNSSSGKGGMRYPSPFFDIAQTFLPTTVKHLFKWCSYYFLTNPIINAVAYKTAEYPITPILVNEPDPDIKKMWEAIVETQLKLRSFEIEVGLDLAVYGNAFVTIHFPFKKYLVCKNCKESAPIEDHKTKYKFKNLSYWLDCEKCGTITDANVKDLNVKDLKKIKLLRWNPLNIDIEHNELTGDTSYFLQLSKGMRSDIMLGRKQVIETIPNFYIEAVKNNKTIKFNPEKIRHLRRPTISQTDLGWGSPLILPVLKDSYYLQVMKKSNEVILQNFISPMRWLFPQAGSANSDPYSSINLSAWRKFIEGQIQRFRQDPGHIPVSPLPVGSQMLGGEGKALMLHQEMELISDQIIAGMHIPRDFLYGGASFSGSNVSMRILENQFLNQRLMMEELRNGFIIPEIASFMEIPKVGTCYSKFKMADDLQRTALLFQFNQALKLSDTSLLEDAGYDVVEEEKLKETELGFQLKSQRKMQLAQAQMQGEQQKVMARYQMEAQRGMEASQLEASKNQQVQQAGGQQQQPMQEMMSPIGEEQQGAQADLDSIAGRIASQLKESPPQEKWMSLQTLKGQNPQLYSLVIQKINATTGSQEDPLNVMQSPLPVIKPPSKREAR